LFDSILDLSILCDIVLLVKGSITSEIQQERDMTNEKLLELALAGKYEPRTTPSEVPPKQRELAQHETIELCTKITNGFKITGVLKSLYGLSLDLEKAEDQVGAHQVKQVFENMVAFIFGVTSTQYQVFVTSDWKLYLKRSMPEDM
jgi:hypothetical protein